MEYVDYEKLHKDTIAKLQEMVNSGKITVKTACGICADFVPESEDERIKKEITELVMQPTWKTEKEFHRRKELCAWLERQGEQKEYTFKSIPRLLDIIEPSDKAKTYCQKLIDTLTNEGYNTDAKIVGEVLKGWNGEDVPMAVMDEQKPADKVKQKFKVDDWVVNEFEHLRHITKIKNDCYYAEGEYVEWHGTFEYGDTHFRLWTIRDAKNGDVLVSESNCGLNTWYCIFKSLDDDESMTVHCYLARDGKFQAMEELCFDKDPRDVKPATKEQRDTLERAMTNAGYRWNKEELKLEKIEKPSTIKFDEPDIEEMVEEYKRKMGYNYYLFAGRYEVDSYKQGLKDMYRKIKGE